MLALGCGGDDALETDSDTDLGPTVAGTSSGLTLGSSSSDETLGTSTSTDGESDPGSSSSDSDPTDPTLDPTDTSSTSDSESESDSDTDDTGGPVCDPWTPGVEWIGADCGHDDDCGYEQGMCLLAEEGFPCGTCSQPCDEFCPDEVGTPETFCIDAVDVGFNMSEGLCVSQCNPEIFGGNGCREGYACVALERFEQPGVVRSVCVPEEFEPPKSDCLQQLDDYGVVYTPTSVPLDHPDGYPNLDCIVEDPVYLHSPVADVGIRYYYDDNEAPILVSCETALSIYHMATIIRDMDGIELEHIGTYSCRVIGGTQTLSQHAFANAIDLSGFLLDDDSFYSVEFDWEKDQPNPVSDGGAWLKDLMDACFAMDIWNIILTPNYNAAHYNHFHVDLTPGSNFYE